MSFVCRGQGSGGVGRKRACGVCVCASSTVFHCLKARSCRTRLNCERVCVRVCLCVCVLCVYCVCYFAGVARFFFLHGWLVGVN